MTKGCHKEVEFCQNCSLLSLPFKLLVSNTKQYEAVRSTKKYDSWAKRTWLDHKLRDFLKLHMSTAGVTSSRGNSRLGNAYCLVYQVTHPK